MCIDMEVECYLWPAGERLLAAVDSSASASVCNPARKSCMHCATFLAFLLDPTYLLDTEPASRVCCNVSTMSSCFAVWSKSVALYLSV